MKLQINNYFDFSDAGEEADDEANMVFGNNLFINDDDDDGNPPDIIGNAVSVFKVSDYCTESDSDANLNVCLAL